MYSSISSISNHIYLHKNNLNDSYKYDRKILTDIYRFLDRMQVLFFCLKFEIIIINNLLGGIYTKKYILDFEIFSCIVFHQPKNGTYQILKITNLFFSSLCIYLTQACSPTRLPVKVWEMFSSNFFSIFF